MDKCISVRIVFLCPGEYISPRQLDCWQTEYRKCKLSSISDYRLVINPRERKLFHKETCLSLEIFGSVWLAERTRHSECKESRFG